MKPRLFCEFPAGLAAVSLRLQGGAHCRPPISRMGNKAGYSKVILGVLGLHSGQGAGAYWWAEADQDVAALLRIYPDPDALLEVARIIRGWAGEEPRALWERLRAERRERGSRSDPGGVAEYAFLHQGSFQYKGPEAGIGRPEGMEAHGTHGAVRPVASILGDAFPRIAEYAMIAASNRLICVGGTRHGGEFATAPEAVAEGMERVAGWVAEAALSAKGMPDEGYNGEHERFLKGERFAGPNVNNQADHAARLADRGWPPVCVSPRIPTATEVSAAIGTPGDLEGCIVYIDGPYENTTGYGHELPRDEQVKIALDFAGAGATVALSEAEPIPALTGAGWYATEITDGRVGQKRTFSKQKREFVTMNHVPQFEISEQVGLFGGGR
jgi:hypothetical protein